MLRDELLKDPSIRNLVVRAYKAGQISEAKLWWNVCNKDPNCRTLEERTREIVVTQIDARSINTDDPVIP
jgi:hypothetical protein